MILIHDKTDFYDNIVKDKNLTTIKFENHKNCIKLPSPEKLLTIIRCGGSKSFKCI